MTARIDVDGAANDLLDATQRDLAALFAAGHPVDARALDDAQYRGTSLGMPAFVDRMTWKIFRKVFHRDPRSGALRGWNVRLEQLGVDGASVPMMRGGRALSFGHFLVHAAPSNAPRGLGGTLLLDYGLGGNARLDPIAVVRDVLVALEPGRFDRLLGWMYLEIPTPFAPSGERGLRIGPLRVPTPSYFLLEREGPMGEIVAAPRAQ